MAKAAPPRGTPRTPPPLLVGSRFLRQHRACISYEHLNLFLQSPSGEVLSSPLEKTRTGHLVLDPVASPTSLTALKEQAEERFGVQLPSDAARLLQLDQCLGALRVSGQHGWIQQGSWENNPRSELRAW